MKDSNAIMAMMLSERQESDAQKLEMIMLYGVYIYFQKDALASSRIVAEASNQLLTSCFT